MAAYCCTGHASTTCAWDKGTNAEVLGLWWTVTRIMNNWCSQTQVSLKVLENISRHNNSVEIIKMTWCWRFNKAIFAAAIDAVFLLPLVSFRFPKKGRWFFGFR